MTGMDIQASGGVAFQAFLMPMEAMLGKPRGRDAVAFYGEFERALRGLEREALEAGLDWYRLNHRRTAWPLPAEALEVCRREARRLHNSRVVVADRPIPEDRRMEVAKRLIHSDMGRRAADEGWIIGLYDFCERELRLPGPEEEARLVSAGRALAARMASYGDDPIGRSALRAIEGKTRRLARIARGEA